MPSPDLPPGFDFTDPDIYAERLPIDELAHMRKVAPIWWNEQAMGISRFDDDGYWVVTKHKDVKEVSVRSDVFSSLQEDRVTAVQRRATAGALSSGASSSCSIRTHRITPTCARSSRAHSRRARSSACARSSTQRAQNIAKAAAAEGSGDFVEQVSCELPLQAIAGLMGVPQEDRKKLFDWSNQMVGDRIRSTPRTTRRGLGRADHVQHADGRGARRNPGDDLVTKLVQADVEGHKLSDDEFGFFVILLAVAGNETTRNSITQGMMAFTDFPDQWELFKRERPATAADEIVRWATPVTSFQRTALEDTELGGEQIKKGQRVVMFYRSANFDEDVFDDPYSFDILRDPNPHVGFGGTGAHFCIGANLARLTIDLIFNAIADDMPDLTPVSPAGAAAVGLAQRHQALAGRLSRRVETPGRELVG